MAWRVGVDSGGTFTDVCLFEDESGRVEVWKVSSTPDDPSRGIAQGVEEGVGEAGAAMGEIGYFGHGTTVGTNALIQHRGVRTGLITTDGFRDLLEIGRQKRPDLYDLQADKPPVLVARDLRLEVPERVRHDGTVETALDEQALREAVRALQGGRRAGGRGLLPLRLRAHRARGDGAAHRRRGIPRGLRLRQPRGGAGIPRIRADVAPRW